jgi:hypothetical protein
MRDYAMTLKMTVFNFRFSRVRTLYACLAENEGELSFEPNQIIINGKRPLIKS